MLWSCLHWPYLLVENASISIYWKREMSEIDKTRFMWFPFAPNYGEKYGNEQYYEQNEKKTAFPFITGKEKVAVRNSFKTMASNQMHPLAKMAPSIVIWGSTVW